MPSPVSATVSSTPPSRGRDARLSWPPRGMASMALSTRLVTASRSSAALPRTAGRVLEVEAHLDPDAARLRLVLPEPARQGHRVVRQRVHLDGAVAVVQARGREALQAPDDVGGAPRRLLDVAEALPHRLVHRAREQELRLAEDDGEDVVELVRDAPRHAAERARLLGLDEAILGGLDGVQRLTHVAVQALVLDGKRRQRRQHLDGLDLVGGKLARPRIGEVEQPHRPLVDAQGNEQPGAQPQGGEEILGLPGSIAQIADGQGKAGGVDLAGKPRVDVRRPALDRRPGRVPSWRRAGAGKGLRASPARRRARRGAGWRPRRPVRGCRRDPARPPPDPRTPAARAAAQDGPRRGRRAVDG